MELRNMKWSASWTAECVEGNLNTWGIGRGIALRRSNGDQQRMSRSPDDLYPQVPWEEP